MFQDRAQSPSPAGPCRLRLRFSRGCLSRCGGFAFGSSSFAGGAGHLFGDTGGLAAAVREVIEVGAAHIAAAQEFDRTNTWAIEWKNTLHSFAIADFADREAGIHARILARDANALEGLHAFALAFLHLHIDSYGIARREVGY